MTKKLDNMQQIHDAMQRVSGVKTVCPKCARQFSTDTIYKLHKCSGKPDAAALVELRND